MTLHTAIREAELADRQGAHLSETPAPGETVLTFDRVSHAYGDLMAICEVSFSLCQREIVCLLGPSGCGKTTLLRVAAGLERPIAGRVLLGGRVLTGPEVMVSPERRGIGLMFQDYALFPHMSILDNVAYGLKRLSRAAARREALAALQRVGMQHYAKAYPHEVSGGEQQRVALARAIAPRPGVLLMDEPFSGLDQRLRDAVRGETLGLLKEIGASALLVTHDPMEAMRVADRIALLRAGRLIQIDRPEAFYRRPVDAQTARFFSDVNELTGIVRDGVVDTALGRFAVDLPEGSRAQVLIRPQGIEIAATGPEAHVVDLRFFGDVNLVTLGVAGLQEPLIARLPAEQDLAQGEVVRLRLREDHVLVFPTGA
ncbi:ABC transporter ATP-binding protein [Rhodoligotrophos defluvii]|uniref:ABC transporter ATP-binding protein n=1 Tax=Rhodoligotrophos defluvii TaxID=2561934 RepID=UPI0010C9E667|nr:ABC transporter ATP-binding protein [Rhodoligotrophos defluvii]